MTNTILIGLICGLVMAIVCHLVMLWVAEVQDEPVAESQASQSTQATNASEVTESQCELLIPAVSEYPVDASLGIPVMVQHEQEEVVYLSPELVQQEAQMPEFGYDYEYVLRVVAAECRGEPYEGQLAVAQCIDNTAERKGLTPEEVVKAKNQYASPVAHKLVTESVEDACCAVFVLGEKVTDEPIQYFYSVRNGFVSKWHEENLEFVMQIGSHKFFKERSK